MNWRVPKMRVSRNTHELSHLNHVANDFHVIAIIPHWWVPYTHLDATSFDFMTLRNTCPSWLLLLLEEPTPHCQLHFYNPKHEKGWKGLRRFLQTKHEQFKHERIQILEKTLSFGQSLDFEVDLKMFENQCLMAVCLMAVLNAKIWGTSVARLTNCLSHVSLKWWNIARSFIK